MVAIAPKTVKVESDGEVAQFLSQVAESPVLVETNGTRYRIVREKEDPFANYDPERARAALDRFFGSLTGVDVEALLEELREQRAQDRQGRPA
jgi:hypothetical protein